MQSSESILSHKRIFNRQNNGIFALFGKNPRFWIDGFKETFSSASTIQNCRPTHIWIRCCLPKKNSFSYWEIFSSWSGCISFISLSISLSVCLPIPKITFCIGTCIGWKVFYANKKTDKCFEQIFILHPFRSLVFQIYVYISNLIVFFESTYLV